MGSVARADGSDVDQLREWVDAGGSGRGSPPACPLHDAELAHRMLE